MTTKPTTGSPLHRPLCPEGKSALGLEAATPCPDTARPWVLAATILASAMAFIDGSVVYIALPALQEDLGANFAALQWVINAYTLLLGGLILIGGSLGDQLGHRRIFIAGLGIFAMASLGCATAPNVTVLIAARALQGLGAALLVPQSLAIIAAAFPKATRGRAIGLWASASAITTAAGPPLGGLFIDTFDWRGVFWLNLPLAVVALFLAQRHILDSRNPRPGPLDWPGGLTAVLGLGALTVGLTGLTEGGFNEITALAMAALGMGLMGLFVAIEAKAPNPLMPLTLFSHRAFAGANLMTLFLYGALGGVLFLLPFDLIERRGLSPSAVGLTLLPFGIIIGLLSRPMGALADGIGPRLPLTAGSLLAAAGAGGLALGLDNHWLGVVVPVAILATGMASVVSPLTTAVINAAPDTLSGVASGVNNAASRLAGLFAVAGLGTVANLVFFTQLAGADLGGYGGGAPRFGELPPPDHPARTILENAFQSAYAMAMGLAAAAAVAAAAIAQRTYGKRHKG
ncbi:MAG: MFS transporter [Candidatus Competibacterales bacterium]